MRSRETTSISIIECHPSLIHSMVVKYHDNRIYMSSHLYKSNIFSFKVNPLRKENACGWMGCAYIIVMIFDNYVMCKGSMDIQRLDCGYMTCNVFLRTSHLKYLSYLKICLSLPLNIYIYIQL